ncbi:hypothetical protein ACP4OV_011358 [Aristida adscensionis]
MEEHFILSSWVQLQLQNHPAELWEDGLKDYISHASEIVDSKSLKDVVNWFRQNKAGSAPLSSPSPAKDEKITSPAADDSNSIVQPSLDSGKKIPITAPSSPVLQRPGSQNIFSFSSQQKTPTFCGIFGDKNSPGDSSKPTFQFGANNGFLAPNTTSIFSASVAQSFSMQTTALFSMNQQSVVTGSCWVQLQLQNHPAELSEDGLKDYISHASEIMGNQKIVDADEDAKPEQPSSPSVKKAEEKGIVVVHEAKCKVYVKHDDATKGWKDIGVGQLNIRTKEGAEKGSKESTQTIIIRNDVVEHMCRMDAWTEVSGEDNERPRSHSTRWTPRSPLPLGACVAQKPSAAARGGNGYPENANIDVRIRIRINAYAIYISIRFITIRIR